MPAPSPSKPSFAQAALEAVRDLFVGLFVQVGRGIALLFRKGQRSSARRTANAAAVRLGERMAETEMGNPLLVRAAVGASKSERPAAMIELGRSGLETGVPPLGLEREYADGRSTRAAAEQVERSHARLVTSLWPSSLIGWVALGINYVAVAFGLLLLWAWLAPTSAPGFAVNLITKPTPPATLPTATLDGVEVRVTKAVLGRQRITGKLNGIPMSMSSNALTLVMGLEIRNAGVEPITYQTWRDESNGNQSEPGRMTDRASPIRTIDYTDRDTPIPPIPDGGVRTVVLGPGETTTDILLFGAPEPKFQRLELYLPGKQVGKPGGMTLSIPAAVVDKPENY